MEDFLVCVLVDGTHYTEIKNEEKDGWISSWALLDLFSGVLEMCVFYLPFLLGSLCFCPEGHFWPVFWAFVQDFSHSSCYKHKQKQHPMCVKVRAVLGKKVFMICMF